MDWTALETATFGSVMVIVLGLLYRFLGQRTDPKLLELIKLQTQATADRDEATAQRALTRDKANERLAEALDRYTDTLGTVQAGIESSFGAIAIALKQIVNTETVQSEAIDAIPGKIIPTINTLTQQLADQKGSVDKMTQDSGENNETIKKILEAVLRLESKIETFQTENTRLGVEMQSAKDELVTLKFDVSKLKPAILPDSDKPKTEPKLKTIPIGKESTE